MTAAGAIPRRFYVGYAMDCSVRRTGHFMIHSVVVQLEILDHDIIVVETRLVCRLFLILDVMHQLAQ